LWQGSCDLDVEILREPFRSPSQRDIAIDLIEVH
jgi:hypothetical protein